MQALGFIEVVGKVAAIEAADTCLKSANVKLIGYEITRGALVTVKVEGDVGAVKSAIDAAKARVVVENKLVATLVIPRPAAGISSMINLECTGEKKEETPSKEENIEEVLNVEKTNISEEKVLEDEGIVSKDTDTVALEEKKVVEEENVKEMNSTVNEISLSEEKITNADTIENEIENNNLDHKLLEEEQLQENKKNNICNLCHDPQCSRKRGQPKNLCIHYGEKIEAVSE